MLIVLGGTFLKWSLHSPPPPRVYKCISVSKADIKVNGEELLGSHLFIKGARGPGGLAGTCLHWGQVPVASGSACVR